MRYLLESGGKRTRGGVLGPRSLALATFGLLVVGSLGDAGALNASPTRARADTVRASTQFHFRKTVFFTPEYLSRIAEAASQKRLEAARAAEAEEAREDERIASYARRYGISRELAQKIHDVALAEGIDPELGFRLVRTESRFKARARGPQGALGLTQLMPSTARALDRSLRTEADILDPTTNLRVGFSYLRTLIERYDGNVRLGLLAYNRGEGTVDRVLRSGRDPENGYSRKVLGTRSANAYRGSGLLSRQGR